MQSGAECGSIFIDDYFLRTWLRRKLTADEYNSFLGEGFYQQGNSIPVLGGRRVVQEQEQKMLEAFEDIKIGFGKGDGNLDAIMALPSGVEIEDDPARGIQNGTITITR